MRTSSTGTDDLVMWVFRYLFENSIFPDAASARNNSERSTWPDDDASGWLSNSATRIVRMRSGEEKLTSIKAGHDGGDARTGNGHPKRSIIIAGINCTSECNFPCFGLAIRRRVVAEPVRSPGLIALFLSFQARSTRAHREAAQWTIQIPGCLNRVFSLNSVVALAGSERE